MVPDGTPEPEDTVNSYTQTSRPGHRAPHVWLAEGRSTIDLFGKGFVLLRFAKNLAVDALEGAANARGVPLSVVDIDHAEAARIYEQPLVLVRPDGHVAWRGETLPADLGKLLDTVRGA